MRFYTAAPVWDHHAQVLPNACMKARAQGRAPVRNARVITFTEARYRNATFSGTFLLAKAQPRPAHNGHWQTVEVICCWFGHRFTRHGPRFRVNMNTAKLLIGYSGPVNTNLAK
jgi:hypothetical protein